jgi:hypothetical protein
MKKGSSILMEEGPVTGQEAKDHGVSMSSGPKTGQIIFLRSHP